MLRMYYWNIVIQLSNRVPQFFVKMKSNRSKMAQIKDSNIIGVTAKSCTSIIKYNFNHVAISLKEFFFTLPFEH